MGRKSKKKGYNGEKEFADLMGGKRIPSSGSAKDFPNDVELKGGLRVEVKRRKSGLKQVYKWLEQEEDIDLLAFREDRNYWLVIMPVDVLKELLEHYKGRKK